MTTNWVYFAHGKESGPWGIKITQLAEVAKSQGFQVESPDYSESYSPEVRIQKLLSYHPQVDPLVLVGSSMGGYVSAVASETLQPKGLFLMAPAVGLEGYKVPPFCPQAQIKMAIHAWKDEIVPVKPVIDFCQKYEIELVLVESDHALISALPLIKHLFSFFLERVKHT